MYLQAIFFYLFSSNLNLVMSLIKGPLACVLYRPNFPNIEGMFGNKKNRFTWNLSVSDRKIWKGWGLREFYLRGD